jgi:hypothetical protein
MKTAISFLILVLWYISPQDASATCEQWQITTSDGGLIVNNSYQVVVNERDHIDQLNRKYCSQGDRHFCGITFGMPQCAGSEQDLQNRYQQMRTQIQEQCQQNPILCKHPPVAHPAETMGGGRN